ncbi:hypothetical protein [Hydrotalea sp.]|uniref:hypothetical protein n=1 Tax=Hydrotalea sp. TaxID=2881279 RepID=UPI003D09F239
MNKLYTLIIMLLSLNTKINCFYSSENSKITGFQIIDYYDIYVTNKDSLNSIKYINFNDTISVFKLENYTLYKLKPVYNFQNNTKIFNSERYFLFRNFDSLGYYFSSIYDTSHGVYYPVDSFLRVNAHYGQINNFKDSLAKDSSYLYATIRYGNNILLEKYVHFDNYKGKNSFDSFYLYYDSFMKNIPYSFSNYMDSLMKMKLFKIEIIFNKMVDVETGFIIPKRRIFIELRKMDTMPDENIHNTFIRFLKQANISLFVNSFLQVQSFFKFN